MAGWWDIVYVCEPSVIPSFQATMTGVLQYLHPDEFGFPRDDCVHPLHGFILAHGGMYAAHDNGHSDAPEISGHFIGAVRL